MNQRRPMISTFNDSMPSNRSYNTTTTMLNNNNNVFNFNRSSYRDGSIGACPTMTSIDQLLRGTFHSGRDIKSDTTISVRKQSKEPKKHTLSKETVARISGQSLPVQVMSNTNPPTINLSSQRSLDCSEAPSSTVYTSEINESQITMGHGEGLSKETKHDVSSFISNAEPSFIKALEMVSSAEDVYKRNLNNFGRDDFITNQTLASNVRKQETFITSRESTVLKEVCYIEQLRNNGQIQACTEACISWMDVCSSDAELLSRTDAVDHVSGGINFPGHLIYLARVLHCLIACSIEQSKLPLAREALMLLWSAIEGHGDQDNPLLVAGNVENRYQTEVKRDEIVSHHNRSLPSQGGSKGSFRKSISSIGSSHVSQPIEEENPLDKSNYCDTQYSYPAIERIGPCRGICDKQSNRVRNANREVHVNAAFPGLIFDPRLMPLTKREATLSERLVPATRANCPSSGNGVAFSINHREITSWRVKYHKLAGEYHLACRESEEALTHFGAAQRLLSVLHGPDGSNLQCLAVLLSRCDIIMQQVFHVNSRDKENVVYSSGGSCSLREVEGMLLYAEGCMKEMEILCGTAAIIELWSRCRRLQAVLHEHRGRPLESLSLLREVIYKMEDVDRWIDNQKVKGNTLELDSTNTSVCNTSQQKQLSISALDILGNRREFAVELALCHLQCSELQISDNGEGQIGLEASFEHFHRAYHLLVVGLAPNVLSHSALGFSSVTTPPIEHFHPVLVRAQLRLVWLFVRRAVYTGLIERFSLRGDTHMWGSRRVTYPGLWDWSAASDGSYSSTSPQPYIDTRGGLSAKECIARAFVIPTELYFAIMGNYGGTLEYLNECAPLLLDVLELYGDLLLICGAPGEASLCFGEAYFISTSTLFAADHDTSVLLQIKTVQASLLQMEDDVGDNAMPCGVQTYLVGSSSRTSLSSSLSCGWYSHSKWHNTSGGGNVSIIASAQNYSRTASPADVQKCFLSLSNVDKAKDKNIGVKYLCDPSAVLRDLEILLRRHTDNTPWSPPVSNILVGHLMGRAQALSGNISEAHQSFNTALGMLSSGTINVVERGNDQEVATRASILSSIAFSNFHEGKFEEALRSTTNALRCRLKEKDPNYTEVAACYGNMAVLCAAMDNYPEAIEAADKCMSTVKGMMASILKKVSISGSVKNSQLNELSGSHPYYQCASVLRAICVRSKFSCKS